MQIFMGVDGHQLSNRMRRQTNDCRTGKQAGRQVAGVKDAQTYRPMVSPSFTTQVPPRLQLMSSVAASHALHLMTMSESVTPCVNMIAGDRRTIDGYLRATDRLSNAWETFQHSKVELRACESYRSTVARENSIQASGWKTS